MKELFPSAQLDRFGGSGVYIVSAGKDPELLGLGFSRATNG